MLIKIFTLKFSDDLEGFDDGEVRAFMAQNEIILIKEQFFLRNNIPYLMIMLTYKPGSTSPSSQPQKFKSDSRKDEYLAILTPESKPLFELLRDWRREISLKEGMPLYVYFNNKQLAHIAVKAPQSLTALEGIEGVGKERIKKYGKDVISIVQSVRKTGQTEPVQQSGQTESLKEGKQESAKQPGKTEPVKESKQAEPVKSARQEPAKEQSEPAQDASLWDKKPEDKYGPS